MIGNVTRGQDFRGLLAYLLHPDKNATILDKNLASSTVNQMAREFEMIAAKNVRVKAKVKHISIAFAPADGEVDPEIKSELAFKLLEELGYNDNQFLIVSHPREDHDHQHDHIHIATNAVKLDGQHVKDSFEWRRTEKILRKLEKEYNLTLVVSSWEKDRSLPTKGQQERMRREAREAAADPTTPAPSRPVSERLQDMIADTIAQTRTVTDFVAHLQHQGVEVRPKITREGVVQGFSYSLEGIAFPGNKLQNCSFPKIQARGVEYDPARDLPNLKLVARGEKLPVNNPEQFTTPEIAKIGGVTQIRGVPSLADELMAVLEEKRATEEQEQAKIKPIGDDDPTAKIIDLVRKKMHSAGSSSIRHRDYYIKWNKYKLTLTIEKKGHQEKWILKKDGNSWLNITEISLEAKRELLLELKEESLYEQRGGSQSPKLKGLGR
jgi:Relaxase/Mobilisation nuclease domain